MSEPLLQVQGVGMTFGGLQALQDAELRDRVEDLLELTGLTSLADRSASDLTPGDQRRLEMARALAGEPSVVLLDEPAAGIGSDGSQRARLTLLRTRSSRPGSRSRRSCSGHGHAERGLDGCLELGAHVQGQVPSVPHNMPPAHNEVGHVCASCGEHHVCQRVAAARPRGAG